MSVRNVKRNLQDKWTTIPTVIGIILALLGTLKPDIFTPEDVVSLNESAVNLVNGLGLAILTVTGMLARAKPEK